MCIVFSSDVKTAYLHTLPIEIDGTKVEAMCDTGAPCVLISDELCKKIKGRKQLTSCKIPYLTYSGDNIDILGEYEGTITYQNIKKVLTIVVTRTTTPALLRRSFLREFNFELVQQQANLVTENNKHEIIIQGLQSEFSDLFNSNLGSYNGEKISLAMSESSKPIFFKPRPLLLAWKPKVENKLRLMIAQGILEPVENSEWGTPLVPILKQNGDFRLCGDYKVTINKYLEDFKYPLPRIEEIFATLQGGELFTKLDLSNAYNQLILDESSQMLCSWSTHIGTLKMKRLPFGIKTAAAIFQKTLENLLRGIENVVVYQDDIIITGKNLLDHLKTIKLVLNKLKPAGFRLNAEKCVFFQKEVSYLGFTINRYGLKKMKKEPLQF